MGKSQETPLYADEHFTHFCEIHPLFHYWLTFGQEFGQFLWIG